MKLYATVASEKAREGQGGNEFLEGMYFFKNKEVCRVWVQVKGKQVEVRIIAGGVKVYQGLLPDEGKKLKDDCPHGKSMETCSACAGRK